VTAGRWGSVPRILASFDSKPIEVPRVIGALDRKQATLRDWLDDRGLPVTDPELLRAVVAGAELLARDVGQACMNGTLPPGLSPLVGSVFAGLVVTLGDYFPEEARHG
jgi:hypothetical protein